MRFFLEKYTIFFQKKLGFANKKLKKSLNTVCSVAKDYHKNGVKNTLKMAKYVL